MENKKFRIPSFLFIIIYFVFLQIPFYAKIALTLVTAIFTIIDYKKSYNILTDFLKKSFWGRSFLLCFALIFFELIEKLQSPLNIISIFIVLAIILLYINRAYKNGSIDIVTRIGRTQIRLNGIPYSRQFNRQCTKNSWIAPTQPFPNSIKRIINADGKSSKINIEITQETGIVNLLIKNKKTVVLDKKILENATFDIEVNEPVTIKLYTHTFEKFVGSFSVKW